MSVAFTYTKIKSEDFKYLKSASHPFAPEYFQASDEYFLVFKNPQDAIQAMHQAQHQFSLAYPINPFKIVMTLQDTTSPTPSIVEASRHFFKTCTSSLAVDKLAYEQLKSNEQFQFTPGSPYQWNSILFETFTFEKKEEVTDATFRSRHFDFSQVSEVPLAPFSPERKDAIQETTSPLILNTDHTVKKKEEPLFIYTPVATKKDHSLLPYILPFLVLGGFGLFYFNSKHTSVISPVLEHPLTLPEPTIEKATPVEPSAAGDSTATTTKINIHSSPSNAVILINQEKMEKKTPYNNVEISKNIPLVIEIQKAGYVSAFKKIQATTDDTQTVMFQLIPLVKKKRKKP